MQTERSLYFSPFPAGLLLFICGSVDADQQEPVSHTHTHMRNHRRAQASLCYTWTSYRPFFCFFRTNKTQRCIHVLWLHSDKQRMIKINKLQIRPFLPPFISAAIQYTAQTQVQKICRPEAAGRKGSATYFAAGSGNPKAAEHTV